MKKGIQLFYDNFHHRYYHHNFVVVVVVVSSDTFVFTGEIGDWKNHFTVAENERFDQLFEERMKSSKLRFKFEPSTK
jgi:hypothetical protein